MKGLPTQKIRRIELVDRVEIAHGRLPGKSARHSPGRFRSSLAKLGVALDRHLSACDINIQLLGKIRLQRQQFDALDVQTQAGIERQRGQFAIDCHAPLAVELETRFHLRFLTGLTRQVGQFEAQPFYCLQRFGRHGGIFEPKINILANIFRNRHFPRSRGILLRNLRETQSWGLDPFDPAVCGPPYQAAPPLDASVADMHLSLREV